MEEQAIALGLVGDAALYCAIAQAELSARLDETQEVPSEHVALAVALYAAALSLESQGADGFTVGEFTLRPTEGAAARAAALRRAAQAILGKALTQEGFAFLGVGT